MSNLRYLARSLAFLPPILLLAGALGVVSCGKSLYSTSSSGSASPTSTSTATGGGFGYVTNVGSGYITEFKRTILTGALKYNARIAAGATSGTNGPKGIAITSNNAFLYASNTKDGNIYQYTVGSDGTLTPMTPPSVPNGVNSSPEQLVTLSSSGTPTWLLVSNYGAGTISAYPITSSGPLGTAVTSNILGMSGPFGLAINSTGTILYVSDNAHGTIYALAFNSTSGALTNITAGLPTSPVPSQGGTFGSPGFLALGPVISGGTSPGAYLLVGDTNPANQVVSLFFIANSGNGVPGYLTYAVPVSFAAIGVAWAGSTIALSANQNTGATASGSITSYILNGSALSTSSNVLSVNGPTTIIVDSQNAFAYSTNQGNGTIGQYQLNTTCGGATQTICSVRAIASDPKISNPGPFGIVLTN